MGTLIQDRGLVISMTLLVCIVGVSAQGLDLCIFSVETVISGTSAVSRQKPSWTHNSLVTGDSGQTVFESSLCCGCCSALSRAMGVQLGAEQPESFLLSGKFKFLGEKQEETDMLPFSLIGLLLLVLLHLWISNWVKKMGDSKSWGSS